MAKKRKPPVKTTSIVLIILAIAVIFVAYSFLFKVPGVWLSCSDGEFIGFGKFSQPPATIVPPPIGCSAEIMIKDSLGNIVCESRDKSESTERIFVVCKELRGHKSESLLLSFTSDSTEYGIKTGETNIVYGK